MYAKSASDRNYCGSELARDGGGSININAGCNDVIASKLAPTGVSGCTRNLPATEITVGASLLAIAVGQSISMLAVMTSSRASSLPQGLVGVREILPATGITVGARLARDGGGSININAGCNDVIASKLAPTGVSGCTRNLPATEITVGASLLAMAVGQSISMLAVMTSSRASSLPQG